MPYVYKRRFLDTEYGVRKEGNIYMIGDSPVLVDTSGDITIKDRVFNPSAWGYLKPSQHCDVGRFLDFDET